MFIKTFYTYIVPCFVAWCGKGDGTFRSWFWNLWSVILKPLEHDFGSKEAWDAKSYMCFEMNKCIFEGVQTVFNFHL